MARAGFCSMCGNDVELTEDGCCPQGHGPETISDVRDADPAAAVNGDAAPDGTANTSSPEPEHHATPMGEVPATRNRTGMIVFAAAAVLLLVALIAGAFVMLPALKKGGGAKPDATNTTKTPAAYKSRVTTSIDFLHALFADDTMKLRPLLTAGARNAITEEQWKAVASAFPTSTVQFSTAKWTSDTTAVVGVKTEGGSEATLTLGAALNSTDTVNVVLTVQKNDERALLRLSQEKDGWHVLSITDATGGATLYDDAFVQNMYEEASKKK